MTVRAIYSVFCDVRGEYCHGWTGEVQEQPEIRQVVRHEARLHGWQRKLVDGKFLDICPACGREETK